MKRIIKPRIAHDTKRPLRTSSQNRGQDDDEKHNSQYQQQTARFVPRGFLIPTRTSQLNICLSRIAPHVLHIRIDRVQLIPLLSDNVRHIPEQFVQLADALLDVSNLGLSLYDE